jgi:hypothetical protein
MDKCARCVGDVDHFLEAILEYKNHISASDLSFAPMENVSQKSSWKAAKAKK